MSRKQPKRKPVPVATRPVRQTHPVVEAARDLPQLTDPLEVEIVLSAVVAPLEDVPWDQVAAQAAAVPSRRSLALLRAMDAMLPGEFPADLAGIEEPSWGELIGQLEIGDCWASDQTADTGLLTIMCTYRYAGQEHCVGFLIDENLGGVVKNAFATKDIATAKSVLEFEPMDSVKAHQRIAEAYDRLDGGPGLGIDADVYVFRLIAQRRIALATR